MTERGTFVFIWILLIIAIFLALAIEAEASGEEQPVWRQEGTLSASNYNPWFYTILWRIEKQGFPEHWETYDATVALNPCFTIGWHGQMNVYRQGQPVKSLSVIVTDCEGKDAYVNGKSLMQSNGIAAEVGWPTRMAYPEWIGNPEYHAEVIVWPREMSLP